jgi:hypothetical protein
MTTKPLPRPRDPIALAKLIGDIATGQVEDGRDDGMTVKRAKSAGAKGGPARAAKLTPEQRSDIARLGSDARWKKS